MCISPAWHTDKPAWRIPQATFSICPAKRQESVKKNLQYSSRVTSIFRIWSHYLKEQCKEAYVVLTARQQHKRLAGHISGVLLRPLSAT
jgi:hypothetical protein